MTEEIIIDVSNCSRKRDDDCMEMPICNEYGDLMGYQSCEAQTLCPYRSQKKIERLEQENKELKEEIRFHNKENSNLLAERNANDYNGQ